VRQPEPWYGLAEHTLKPLVAGWFNWRFEGLENVPREGPVLVACNHISYFDPLAHAYMVCNLFGIHPLLFQSNHLFISVSSLRLSRQSCRFLGALREGAPCMREGLNDIGFRVITAQTYFRSIACQEHLKRVCRAFLPVSEKSQKFLRIFLENGNLYPI